MGELAVLRQRVLGGRTVLGLAALGLAAHSLTILAQPESMAPLRELVAKAREGGREAKFRAPEPAALEQFRAALARWAAGSPAPVAELAACGFEHVRVRAAGGSILAIREKSIEPTGGGLFLLADPPARRPRLVLQAPHSFFDLGTGDVALGLFETMRPAALFVNNVHRRNPSTDGIPGRPADVAHNARNFFHAATQALAAAWPDSVFVQIHGFEASRMRDAARNCDFILSDGRGPGRGSELLRAAAASFRAQFGDERVAVHGENTRELGATTNEQGRLLNAESPNRFLHVEIAAAQRKRFVARSAELAKLRKALEGCTR